MATREEITEYKEKGLFILVDVQNEPRTMVTLLDANALWVHTPDLAFSLSYRVAALSSHLPQIAPPVPGEIVITFENARDPSVAERVSIELSRARETRRLQYGAAARSGHDLMQTARDANERELLGGRIGKTKITPLPKDLTSGSTIKRTGAGKPATKIIVKLKDLYDETFKKGLDPPKSFAYYLNVSNFQPGGSGTTRTPNPTMGGVLKWYPSVPIVSRERAGYELAMRALFSQLHENRGNTALANFEPYRRWSSSPDVPEEIRDWIETTWPQNLMVSSLRSIPPSDSLSLGLSPFGRMTESFGQVSTEGRQPSLSSGGLSSISLAPPSLGIQAPRLNPLLSSQRGPIQQPATPNMSGEQGQTGTNLAVGIQPSPALSLGPQPSAAAFPTLSLGLQPSATALSTLSLGLQPSATALSTLSPGSQNRDNLFSQSNISQPPSAGLKGLSETSLSGESQSLVTTPLPLSGLSQVPSGESQSLLTTALPLSGLSQAPSGESRSLVTTPLPLSGLSLAPSGGLQTLSRVPLPSENFAPPSSLESQYI
jgi:hypothetical protein